MIEMLQPSGFSFARLLTVALWILLVALPAAARETPSESAVPSFARPGPDQAIVTTVPVADSPPVSDRDQHGQGRGQAHSLHGGILVEREILTAEKSDAVYFPTTFDTSRTNNFTSDSCPDFISQLLADSTFTDCHAISTLLRDSTGFFHTLSSVASTSQVLDIACEADVASCAASMSTFVSDLLDDANCGLDYADGNPLVTSAYINMVTYEPIYRATCLTDPETSDYCLVNAATNTTNPTDYDIYLVPYGSTIDSKSPPTCDACLQATVDTFARFAQVDGQPLAESYIPTAMAVNAACGPDFANVSIVAGQEDDLTSAAELRLSPRSLPLSLWVSVSMSVGILLSF